MLNADIVNVIILHFALVCILHFALVCILHSAMLLPFFELLLKQANLALQALLRAHAALKCRQERVE